MILLKVVADKFVNIRFFLDLNCERSEMESTKNLSQILTHVTFHLYYIVLPLGSWFAMSVKVKVKFSRYRPK